MPTVTINAVVYSGQPGDDESIPRAPIEALLIVNPITHILEGLDGTRNKMDYGDKYEFKYTWKKVPQATRDAIWVAHLITIPFNITHHNLAVYSVQFETKTDYNETVDHTIPGGLRYYNIDVLMHEP